MNSALDRRRLLIAGAASVAAAAAGSTYLLWGSAGAANDPADGSVRIVPGATPPTLAAPPPASPQPLLSDVTAVPDRDTEARLNRLVEDDAANSRQRMRERQERRFDAPQPVSAPSADAAPTEWAP